MGKQARGFVNQNRYKSGKLIKNQLKRQINKNKVKSIINRNKSDEV
jgi:hypothetical protein